MIKIILNKEKIVDYFTKLVDLADECYMEWRRDPEANETEIEDGLTKTVENVSSVFLFDEHYNELDYNSIDTEGKVNMNRVNLTLDKMFKGFVTIIDDDLEDEGE